MTFRNTTVPPGALEVRFISPLGFEWDSFERDGRKIRTGKANLEGSKAVIIDLPGLTEFTEKNFEFVRNLQERGYGYMTMDWMGQGGSGRFLPNSNKIHPESLQDHLDDLDVFIRDHVIPQTDAPLVIMGRSMGGHLVLRHMGQNPDIDYLCASVIAPMEGIPLPDYAPFVMPLLHLANQLEASSRIVVSGHKWQYDHPLRNAGDDQYSSDSVRGDLQMSWSTVNSNLQWDGVTIRFLIEALRSINESHDEHENIMAECLVAVASGEEIVDNGDIRSTIRRLPNAKPLLLNGARHEILHESDTHRAEYLDALFEMIDRKLQEQGLEAKGEPSHPQQDQVFE